ncbi:hypothetical protein EG329_003472 [Mollisiaceae sp. DMI_Dod_QoI]|nr:hypothetical protein EG329_003472 [Helotiales sp. DMI_Dod_QoI]
MQMFHLLQQSLTFKAVTLQYDPDDLQLHRSSYRKHKRRASTFYSAMHASVQEPVEKEAVTPNKSRTGFPEPFNEDRNTTLPHPDADTSPNATIEAPDFDLTRTHSRSSFLHRKHNAHHLWGRHESLEKLYDNITYADDNASADHREGHSSTEQSNEGDVVGDRDTNEDGERKHGILKKLISHKS